MDLHDSPAAAAFRQKVRAFLDDHLPPDWAGLGALSRTEAVEFTRTWRQTLHRNGLLGLTWPVEYGGGGLTKLEQVVLVEECARARVPLGPPGDTITVKLMGNALVRWGTEDQKRTFLPRILAGQDVWCQGYSEPEAGSDLAALRTTAVAEGETWRVNGQKIWTSNGMEANWIFLLVRTDAEAPKNRGITFVFCPTDTPGVEIRPIRQLNNGNDFCEVFLTDVRIPIANVLGEVNGGWQVANSVLGHERGEEAAANPVIFRHELDRLIALARQYGRADDPIIRDRLAWCHTKVEIMRALGYRILTQVLRDNAIGPEASIAKLYWSEYHLVATELAMDIMGVAGLVAEGDAPLRWFRTDEPGAPNTTASWQNVFLLNALSGTVYAGTSQIQRNILGESLLGLPREPR